MLILSRKTDEKIVIGGNITVTVIELRGNKVRIGIDAPSDVTVHRQEIQEEINKSGDSAMHILQKHAAQRRNPV